MALSIKQQEEINKLFQQIDYLEPYSEQYLFRALRRNINELDFVLADRYDDVDDGEIRREMLFTILGALRLDIMPPSILRSLRMTIMKGTCLCDCPATALLMNAFENIINKFKDSLGIPEIRKESHEALNIIYKNNEHNKGYGYDYREVQSSVILEIQKKSSTTLNIFVPSALMKVMFPEIRWHETLPGLGFYQEPTEEQMKKIIDDFIGYDSIAEKYDLISVFNPQPEFRQVSGGVMRVHITEISYHF